MANRLYRSESEKVLGGVCGGLGEFLGIDPVFVRIFFIVWTVLGEFSVLIYFLLWVIIPRETSPDADRTFEINDLGARFRQMGNEVGDVARNPSSELITFTGVGLIAWGLYSLLRSRLPIPDIFWNYSQYAWPALLIIAGVFIIFRTTRKK